MTIPAEATRPDNGFTGALHVSGPADEHAGKLMLFGQFVGSWDLEWAGTGANGEPATATGELHFGKRLLLRRGRRRAQRQLSLVHVRCREPDCLRR